MQKRDLKSKVTLNTKKLNIELKHLHTGDWKW